MLARTKQMIWNGPKAGSGFSRMRLESCRRAFVRRDLPPMFAGYVAASHRRQSNRRLAREAGAGGVAGQNVGKPFAGQ